MSMAEKYPDTDKNKESIPSKILKLGAAVLAFALGIDILRNH